MLMLFTTDLNIAVAGSMDAINEVFWARKNVVVFGQVDSNRLNELRIQSMLHLCIEKNPACPNSVIESLVNELPVFGLSEGSLPELIKDTRTLSAFSHRRGDTEQNFDEIMSLIRKMRVDDSSYRDALKAYKSQFSPQQMRSLYNNLLT